MTLHIDEMFAFTQVDENGDEGIVGFRAPTGDWFPLVGADMERVESLKPMALELARISGRPVNLIHLSVRENVETIAP